MRSSMDVRRMVEEHSVLRESSAIGWHCLSELSTLKQGDDVLTMIAVCEWRRSSLVTRVESLLEQLQA